MSKDTTKRQRKQNEYVDIKQKGNMEKEAMLPFAFGKRKFFLE